MQHLPQQTRSRHDFLETERKDDRVMVVVFLRGGADGLTLVPPTGSDAYYRARPILAVKSADAIALDDTFSLNPTLRPMMKRLESGAMTIIHGAGSEDRTRSHFEAQDTMEHGGVDTGSGWLARYLRAALPAPGPLSAVAIGTTQPESLRGAPAGAVIQSVRDFAIGDDDPGLIDGLGKLYAAEAGSLGRAGRDTLAAVTRLRELRANIDPPAGGAVYPDTEFGRGLREIAKLVKADVGLVTTTIDLNGWDTHFVQATVIDSLMTQLAAGVDAFLTDLGEHEQRVTVVVMTEFGRRLRENTSFGTDHGAGSVMMVLGDGARVGGKGGKVISGWPDLADEHLDSVGDVPATINYRDVLAPVLTHVVPGVDLSRVFPGHRFTSIA